MAWHIDRKETGKSSDNKGINATQHFEIMSKIAEMEGQINRKFDELEKELAKTEQESKGQNHQMNRLMVEIQNKGNFFAILCIIYKIEMD